MTDFNHATQALWTEDETADFGQTLVTFGKTLPARQRAAFAAILARAGAQHGDGQRHEDVEGFFFYRVFFFSVLQAAATEVGGTADLAKAMEGQKLYIPQ
jgi:hypothetical protein